MSEEGTIIELPVKPKPPNWAKALNEKMLIGAELMARGNYNQKQIAEMVGVGEQTISRRWKHNAIFLKYVDYLATQNTLNAALRIKGLTLEAIDTYSDLLRHPNPHIRARIAKDVLDRAGVKDFKFDLLPKDEKQVDKDTEAIKNRLLALLDAESAGGGVRDLAEYMHKGKKIEVIDAEYTTSDGELDIEDLSEEYEQDED